MRKATLEFDEEDELRLALNGSHYWCCLTGIRERLRQLSKHAESPTFEDALEAFRIETEDVDWEEVA